MKREKYCQIALWLSICVLWGCSGSGTPTEEPQSTCDAEALCEGGKRVYCKDGERVTEACGVGQTCVEGECVLSGGCDETHFEATCHDGIAVFCDAGQIRFNVCQLGCSDGVCIETKCPSEKPYPYCNETGEVVTCGETGIEQKPCQTGETCYRGACKSLSALCGNGDLDVDEICDDGEENGQYGKCRIDCLGRVGCGDGTIQDPEEICDDGEDNGKYTKCSMDCKRISQCGDGIVDSPDEVCDDGNDNGQDGKCALDCQNRIGCGNGIIDAEAETCDPPSKGMFVTCESDCSTPNILFEEYPKPGNVSTHLKPLCESGDLWQKYLLYRERFVGEASKHIPGFISWGTEAGESLPAGSRDPSFHCATNWRYHHDGADCAFTDISDAHGAYSWGDTSLWLGIMLHWLALEYKMYQVYGLDTTETENLIALALKAFDRLDLAAEPFFDLEPKLDGFFIRDDLPRDFYMKDGQYRFERTDGFLGYACAASNSVCQIYSGATSETLLKDGAFVSQDQITGIYEGLGMIGKFVDADAEYDGMKLRHHALSGIHRIIMYLREHHWLIGVETASGWLQVPEEWGGYTQMLSAFFAEGANSICGTEFGMADYHDEATRVAKELIPGLISVLWPLWETENNYNRNLILRVMNYTNLWDDAKYDQVSLESGRELWALSHALYWGRPLADEYPLWRMASILSQAPCEGPCSGASCDHETPGWMGENYFVSPNQRLGSQHFEGEYNGLDYLIAHNLYALAYAQQTGRGYTQSVETNLSGGHQLKDMISGGEIPDKYRVSENIEDMSLAFCGRPFADWIRDNALGLIDIYTGDYRWSCQWDGTCTISRDASPYSHRNSVIIGTEVNDTIHVPKGYHHCISTLGGDDHIIAQSGMHIIEGGSGDDTITTHGPHVTIYGGDGDDKLYPGNGYHLIDAGRGHDFVDSGSSSGTHLIYGGDGDDVIRAGEGGNYLVGGPGHDVLEGGNGNNVAWGNDGNDKFKFGNGNNTILPGDGNAFVFVGNGNNSITTISPQNDHVSICFGTGKNSIYAGWSSTSLCSAVQNSDIHDQSCRPVLTSLECNLTAYQNWQ